jgi:glycosyltransferase involved in cell wall biosynthesis
MAALLSRAALVCLLSDYEAHPITVMEALALGRPVLVAYTSGLAELADRGLVSAVPARSTPDQIAQAVLDGLRHPRVAEDVALPTWEECTARLLAVYRSVVDETRCAS